MSVKLNEYKYGGNKMIMLLSALGLILVGILFWLVAWFIFSIIKWIVIVILAVVFVGAYGFIVWKVVKFVNAETGKVE